MATATSVLSAQERDRVVRALRFEGNQAIDDVTLASVIATTNSNWWATSSLVRWIGLGEKRYLSEVEFRRDVVRLILFYRQSGYMNAVVDTSVQRTRRDAYITFRIHEGDPVRVTRLDITGLEGILNVAKLKKELPLQVGDPFNRFLMQASADTILHRLRNGGYPYAEGAPELRFRGGRAEGRGGARRAAGRGGMRVGEVAIKGLRDVDTGPCGASCRCRRGEEAVQAGCALSDAARPVRPSGRSTPST
jgi:outer membrane protein assembly factor BamA